MTQTPNEQLDHLISSWEEQQDAYVNRRADRFEIVLDALAYARPGVRSVLDIGGGLGSFSKLILRRFPDAQVVTVDHDPALLRLAAHNLAEFGSRSVIVDADLRDPAWPRSLAGVVPDAVVSSTALHWLSSAEVVSLYALLGALIAADGVFFNADHLSHDVSGPFFRDVSIADDTAQQRRGFDAGVPDWDRWWNQVRSEPAFVDLVAERDRRFSDAPDNLDLTPDFHREALRVAGFAETGTLWQHFDDYVVYAVR
ncbi:hypothetical protein BVC93_08630 [Mycobacterium sp. MS1601]|uniref:class I SAM-dependent methyltransferase n=1 Tax=Mycobacterium sp. MS1601 TaxID=1936029 RepID=UPI0009791726|nr:class I SAM-dependent methyltransferase [Mycobacterium sp. MS1601]AQA02488.1 hypothetical protein BVC93_08630 [Mycobacterium sp. MS1601]